MTNPIVVVSVAIQQAPTPNNLQKQTAFVSQGGTTLAANSTQQLVTPGQLAGILAAPLTLASLTWTTNVATGTTAAPHGWTDADVILATIAGVTPTAYNGTFSITITGTETFTYPLLTNPGGPATIEGTVALQSITELTAMNTTFWAQGQQVPVSVLELGETTPLEGIAALTTWLTDNPKTYYTLLVPREWDNLSQYRTLIAAYESPTSMLYFLTTTTTGTYSGYTSQMKDVIMMAEAPGVATADTEFSLAAAQFDIANYAPSSSNKVTPLAFTFEFDVTPYPLPGNNAFLTAFLAAAGNYIGTGGEGGITNTLIRNGLTKDGNPFTFWYSVDWMQINLDLNLSNTIINGSNNPTNPLYYDQDGINRLQAAAAQTVGQALTYGLALGSLKLTQLSASDFATAAEAGTYDGLAVVNAEPFNVYTAENPDDYDAEIYNGITVLYTPLRGFTKVGVNLVVSFLA